MVTHKNLAELTDREVTFRSRPRALLVAVAALAAPAITATTATTAQAAPGTRITVGSGETLELTATTRASVLTIAAGTYRGTVVLTVAEATDLAYSDLTFPFRQALYVDADGVNEARSVPSNVRGGTVTDTKACDIALLSDGEAFNGVYVTGGATYTLTRPRIAFAGNGRCDFIGYGASVVGTGAGTTLVVNGAKIRNQGVVRTALIADASANVAVKNSHLHCADGTLPAEYVPTGDTRYMMDVPWMLGLSGNVRTTNLLGAGTRATFVNSTISSEKWGALSVDGGSYCTLTAINSTIANTGGQGYGSYAIGNVTEHFLGCTFDVGDYALIHWGARAHYGDSTEEAVAALNDSLELGLTSAELKKRPVRPTTIDAGRFMVLWYNDRLRHHRRWHPSPYRRSGVHVQGGRGHRHRGRLRGRHDQPGRQHHLPADGHRPPEQRLGDGQALAHGDDRHLHGTHHRPGEVVDLGDDFTPDDRREGDVHGDRPEGRLLQRGTRRRQRQPPGPEPDPHLHHLHVTTITSAQYREISEVTNTPSAVLSNGVLVTLDAGSTWTVTGTSYLSALTLATNATVKPPTGKTLTLTIDGTETQLEQGKTYTGALTLTVS